MGNRFYLILIRNGSVTIYAGLMTRINWDKLTDPLRSLANMTSETSFDDQERADWANDVGMTVTKLVVAIAEATAGNADDAGDGHAANYVLEISSIRIVELVKKREELRSSFVERIREASDEQAFRAANDAHTRMHKLGILYGRELVEWARIAETASVLLAKTQGNLSWADIGTQLDIRAQSAHERYTTS